MQPEITKELKWGETPWDNLSPEELLREIQRLYAAFAALYGIIHMDLETGKIISERSGQKDPGQSPYWGPEGVGGAALEMSRQIFSRLEAQGYDLGENLYRSFYRYARDLLFEPSGYRMVRAGWMVCPKCGSMIGSSVRPLEGAVCGKFPGGQPGCTGVMRPLSWDDLKPQK